MISDEFVEAEKLLHKLATLKIDDSGKTLENLLKLGSNTSLWESIKPFLLLYRSLPLKKDLEFLDANDFKERLKFKFRKFLFLLFRIKFSSVYSFKKNKDIKHKKYLIMFSQSSIYRDTLQPVEEELKAKKISHQTINLNIDFSGNNDLKKLINFKDISLVKKIKNYQIKLKNIREIFFNVENKKILNHLEKEFGLSENSLEKEFKILFDYRLKVLIFYKAISEIILKKFEPKVLIVGDDCDYFSRIFLCDARSLKSNTFLIQQGITRKDYPEWRDLISDNIACMSEYSKEVILSQTEKKINLEITGNPGFDKVFYLEESTNSKIKDNLNLKDKTKVILFASQPNIPPAFISTKIRKDMFLAIYKSIKALPSDKVMLLIKPHPSENINEINEIFKNSKNFLILKKTEDIIPYIQICDLFITFYSQTFMQALCADKPVINLLYPNSSPGIAHLSKEVTNLIESEKALIEIISNFYFENQDIKKPQEVVKNFLKKNVSFFDGESSKRILKMMEAL